MTDSSFSRRRSIGIDGVTHGATPIPMGSRIGNLLYSSGIMGKDPATGQLAEGAAQQAQHMFQNLRALLHNGGATLDDVLHVRASVKDDEYRALLNAEWIKCFPDPESRPARLTQRVDLPFGMLLQIEVVAVVQDR